MADLIEADEENILKSANYVRDNLPKAKMELLPYHKFGYIKYEALGIPYQHDEFYRPSKRKMENL